MKRVLFFSLLILASCVDSSEKAPDSVGDVRRFEPLVVSELDTVRLSSICRSLSSKEELLSVLVSTGTEYTFAYNQKGCSESELPTPKSVVTTIARPESDYVFKSKNGEGFGFPDVETATRGVMKEICANLSSLMNPIQTSSSGALWFTTITSSEYCKPSEDSLCVHLQRGSIIDDLNYKIHTNEFIKFKVIGANRGFFTERHLISSANCSKGTLEKRAELK